MATIRTFALAILLFNIDSIYSQNLTFTNITSPRIVPDFTTNYVNQYLGCKITSYTNESTSNYFITQQHQDYSEIIFRADAFNPTLHSLLPLYGNYSIDAGNYDKTFALQQVASYDICTSPATNDIILCYHRITADDKFTYTTCTFFNRNSQSWTPIVDVSNATSYQQYPPKVLCLYDAYLIIWGGSVYNSANNISDNFQYTLLDLYGHFVRNNFGQTLIEYDVNGFGADFTVATLGQTIMLQYVTRNFTNNQLNQANLTMSLAHYTSIEDAVPIQYISSTTMMQSINNNRLNQYYFIYQATAVNVTDTCCFITPYATVDAQSEHVRFWLRVMDNTSTYIFNNETKVDEISWGAPGKWDYHLIALDERNVSRRNNHTLDKYFIAVYSFWDNEEIADVVGVVYRITYDMQNNKYTLQQMNTVTLVEVIGVQAKTDCVRYFCMDYLVSEQFMMVGWNGCDHFYGQTWETTFPYYPH